MIEEIEGLHHVTSLAASAQQNNDFFTGTLGLRRIKKTVNFDAPEVYHLYYGDESGTPGTVMTYFPFPGMRRGRAGTGEVSVTEFAVPAGATAWWRQRLEAAGVAGIAGETVLGETRLRFEGPDGDGFALVETENDPRTAWSGGEVPAEAAIRGFRGARLRLRDTAATAELLRLMGYEHAADEGALSRYVRPGGNAADRIDLEAAPDAAPAEQGAGSVHHIAFAVPDRAAQARVRDALTAAGQTVTPQIDRDYFWAIYFRTPGGVLFEVATDEPGFARDEDPAHLGEALKLPTQHEHLRPRLETHLPPIRDRERAT